MTTTRQGLLGVTITQERVRLRCGHNLVTFHWPHGSDLVTVTGFERTPESGPYSVEEAHELFMALLDAGAY